MTILDLKKEMMKAKKEDKTKASILMLLVDNAQKLAKEKNENVTEKHIINAIKKQIKQTEEAISMGVEKAKIELEILKSYAEKILPKQLSDEELSKIIKNLVEKENQMGKIMGYLKKEYGEKIDMKKASQMVKEILNSK